MKPKDQQIACARRLDRACYGLSHRALGALLGLPGETVRRYRMGITPVPLHVAAAVCRKLRVSPAWIIFGTLPVELETVRSTRATRGSSRRPPARSRRPAGSRAGARARGR